MSKTLMIVVANRGWVYAGKVEKTGDGVTITEAQNIRRWGTENGLGELAARGPQANTRLDAYGTVHVPTHAVVCLIEITNAEAWNRVFAAEQA